MDVKEIDDFTCITAKRTKRKNMLEGTVAGSTTKKGEIHTLAQKLPWPSWEISHLQESKCGARTAYFHTGNVGCILNVFHPQPTNYHPRLDDKLKPLLRTNTRVLVSIMSLN